MLDVMHDWIATVLDPIGVVVGLVLAIPVFWTWIDVVFGERRRRRRRFEEARTQPGQHPAILILDLLPEKEIRLAVEHYRCSIEVLKAIPEERIIRVTRDHWLKVENMPDLAREIRIAAARLVAMGTDTVHYFHAGPAVLAAIVGAELANAHRVLLYQYSPDGYRNFGPLRPDW